MDKFDFDLYKKQTDEIDLTDKQKQDLINNILDKEKRTVYFLSNGTFNGND